MSDAGQTSEYEEERDKRVADNIRYLQSLQISPLLRDIQSSAKLRRPKRQPRRKLPESTALQPKDRIYLKRTCQRPEVQYREHPMPRQKTQSASNQVRLEAKRQEIVMAWQDLRQVKTLRQRGSKS